MEGLSPYIKEQILAGRAVLFLGAGATIPATGSNGRTGLSGNALRDKLCEKFLGGEGKGRPLTMSRTDASLWLAWAMCIGS